MSGYASRVTGGIFVIILFVLLPAIVILYKTFFDPGPTLQEHRQLIAEKLRQAKFDLDSLRLEYIHEQSEVQYYQALLQLHRKHFGNSDSVADSMLNRLLSWGPSFYKQLIEEINHEISSLNDSLTRLDSLLTDTQ